MPQLLGAIQQRFACRAFQQDRPLRAEELALLCEAGRLAPSAFGLEPWRFIPVTDAAARARIAGACFDQPAATNAAAFIVIVALVAALDPDSDYVRARFAAEARGGEVAPIDAAYRALHRAAPLAAWAQGQCHFAAAQMLLQATHMGLGSCPIGGFDPAALAQSLSLPPGEVPALVIALGQCAEPPPARIRKPLE